MKKTYVTESFSHFNTCKRNVVYLENVNFVFISRKKVYTLTTMEFISRKQLISILDEKSFNILVPWQGICTITLLQGLLENVEFSMKLPWLLSIYSLGFCFSPTRRLFSTQNHSHLIFFLIFLQTFVFADGWNITIKTL